MRWVPEKIAGIAGICGAILVFLLLFLRICIRKLKQEQGYLRQEVSSVNLKRGTVPLKAFRWSYHPSLMLEALEKGWSAFALYAPPSYSSKFGTQISWEVGGTDFMQVIRFNSGLPTDEKNFQFLQSGLPLPGPFLGTCSYPQEAYFELSILAEGREYDDEALQDTSINLHNDSVKLMTSKTNSSYSEQQQLQNHLRDEQTDSSLMIMEAPSVEKLCTLPMQILGVGFVAETCSSFTEVGTICYYSNGQVFLNGSCLKQKKKKNRCWRTDGAGTFTTIGCGFNPITKRVLFTMNGEVCYEGVDCHSFEEFGYPLYAAVWSNYDATVLMNFGQNSFKYLPPNASRSADPGNHRPPALRSRSALTTVAEMDSGDLFSMTTLDSRHLDSHHLTTTPSDADSDLFEIVLDGGAKERKT